MYKSMFILLFFSCCFAQGETTFDQDGENFSSQDSKNLEKILRKLSVMLNNDIHERMSNIEADLKDLKEKLADVYSIAERNFAQINSVSEQHETRILNNIQRLNSIDNKMVDMKVKLARNERKIVKNSNTISDVNSKVERNSAQVTSVSEEVEQRQAMIVNNIQRLEFTNMLEMKDIKEKIVNLEEEIDQNSDTISDVNSTDMEESGQFGPKEDKGEFGQDGPRKDGEEFGQDGPKGESQQVGPKEDKGESQQGNPKEDKGQPGQVGFKGDKGEPKNYGPKSDLGPATIEQTE